MRANTLVLTRMKGVESNWILISIWMRILGILRPRVSLFLNELRCIMVTSIHYGMKKWTPMIYIYIYIYIYTIMQRQKEREREGDTTYGIRSGDNDIFDNTNNNRNRSHHLNNGGEDNVVDDVVFMILILPMIVHQGYYWIPIFHCFRDKTKWAVHYKFSVYGRSNRYHKICKAGTMGNGRRAAFCHCNGIIEFRHNAAEAEMALICHVSGWELVDWKRSSRNSIKCASHHTCCEWTTDGTASDNEINHSVVT